jgi:hypothetical protein
MFNKVFEIAVSALMFLGVSLCVVLFYLLFNTTRPIEVRRLDQNCIEKKQGPIVSVECHATSIVNNNFDMVPHD